MHLFEVNPKHFISYLYSFTSKLQNLTSSPFSFEYFCSHWGSFRVDSQCISPNQRKFPPMMCRLKGAILTHTPFMVSARYCPGIGLCFPTHFVLCVRPCLSSELEFRSVNLRKEIESTAMSPMRLFCKNEVVCVQYMYLKKN